MLKKVSIFQVDPTVKESGIVVLLRKVWVCAGKRESFVKGRRQNKSGRNRERENIS